MKETLRDLRKARGMKTEDVAKVLTVSKSSMVSYEQGVTWLHISQIKPLAELYGVSADVILEAALAAKEARQ